jgi:segregation and condensation protein B
MSIKNKMEAIMLIGGDEIKISDLAKHFELTEKETTDILRDLKFERRNTGISLEITGDNVYFVTNPKYGEDVTNFFERDWKPRKLSAAALETLTIIAYKQPITKSEIAAIRGILVDGVIFSLLEKQLIRICGKKSGPGRPNLYEVTDKFLGYINIDNIEDLPGYTDLKTGDIYNKIDISKIIAEKMKNEIIDTNLSENGETPETSDLNESEGILYEPDEEIDEEPDEESVD